MKLKKRYHWLAYILNLHEFEVGAEVGAATGVTTEYILGNCRHLQKLYVADDWRPIPGSGQWERTDMEQIFRNKFERDPRVRILKELSWDASYLVSNEELDFVFIDASHDKESVMKDITSWLPCVKKDGIVCGHDLHFPGVVQALEELGVNYMPTNVDNCWIAHKINLYKDKQMA